MTKHVWKYYLIALIVISIDQALKLYVHFNMALGTSGQIKLLGDWIKLCYTLNPGMAFGLHFGLKYGKLLLTIIRVITSGIIFRYLGKLASNKKVMPIWLWGWALILGGAIGNAIDSTFYGVFLHNAPHAAPMHWFYGQVIDMIYIDLWKGRLPGWIPFVGGEFVYCLPIFNVADVAILGGMLLVFTASKLMRNQTGAQRPTFLG